MEKTTIIISKKTLKMLKQKKLDWNLKSIDEVILKMTEEVNDNTSRTS